MKALLTLCLLAVIQSTNAQTTNPAPFCPYIYDGGTTSQTHYISSFTLGSFTNVSGTVQQPFPHYIFYNNLNPGPFLHNHSYLFNIEIDTFGVNRQVYMYADWNRDFVMSSNELIFQSAVGANVSSVIGVVTIPVLSGSAPVRVRVILAEDMSGVSYSSCATTVDWGETEDYEILVGPTTSVSENSIENFLYYPNPTSGIITIDSEMQLDRIEVIDLAAKKVLDVQNFNGSINISELESGTYILIARTGSGSDVRKLIYKI